MEKKIVEELLAWLESYNVVIDSARWISSWQWFLETNNKLITNIQGPNQLHNIYNEQFDLIYNELYYKGDVC